MDDISETDAKSILEQNYKYFLEFSKLKEANTVLNSQLNVLLKEKALFRIRI